MRNLFVAARALTAEQARHSLNLLNWEAFFSGAMFSLGSGSLLAAYALALGANSLQVGILAAIPPASQVIRLPAVIAIRKLRSRKRLGLPALLATQLAWIPIGAVPLILQVPGSSAVIAVIALLALRGLFGPVWVTASTSWVRDLAPPKHLASCFGRRQALATLGAAVAPLAGSLIVQWWLERSAPDQQILGYSIILLGGVLLLGLMSPLLAARASEPLMPASPAGSGSGLRALLTPLRDPNCGHLLRFLFAFNFCANLAVPFFVVYMLTALAISLPVVVAMTVLGLINSALFVGVWGPLADRVGSKAVLSLSASLYLLVILGWVFAVPPAGDPLAYALLVVLNGLGGIAMAGATLTMNTLALKIAPEGEELAYSGIAGIAASLGAGTGPILGGFLIDFFLDQKLDFSIVWSSATDRIEFPRLEVLGFDFVFLLALLATILSLRFLAGLREEGEASRDAALAELMTGIDPVRRAVNTLPGLGLVSSISYQYLRRVPGADVALGVSAYQVAAATRAATDSAVRGHSLMRDLSGQIGAIVQNVAEEVGDVAGNGAVLARNSVRGALHAAANLKGDISGTAAAAIAGTLKGLEEEGVDREMLLRAAACGAVQGAVDAGADPQEASEIVLAAATQAAQDAGIGRELAADLVVAGINDARRPVREGDPTP